MSSFTPFREKMEQANVSEAAILSFERNYHSLLSGASSEIRESSIEPVADLPMLEDIAREGESYNPEYLAKTVVIKLNGGLGTSMGLQKAKSLLEVKPGATFLDVIVDQISYLRQSTGAPVKFLLMNSFSTSEDTLSHLSQHEDPSFSAKEEVELMQNQIPKIDAASMAPASNPDNSDLEWCPPGHGDLYAAIEGSGWLDKLLADGVQYAFMSNSDNLGAVLDPSILRYFAESGKPFLMEATRRTEADKKGGHLAVRVEDQQMLLREVAQTADSDLAEFQNVEKHRYFNTNSLWIDLAALKAALQEHGGVMPLPVIINKKTVDPRNKASTPVYQLETAMGAAIECFQGAGAICVPRSRFAPVKTTADLFALRSDAYTTTEDGRVALIPERNAKPPIVSLSDAYKLVDSLGGLGIPSLRAADKLSITGPVRFCDDVTIRGVVSIENTTEELSWVASGIYQNETVTI
ncbi:UTP--glucose-1-phosphate uridylyltransferase [Rubritalea marina]|uniref:UTP--glucose-1-phosphate uridylyltransferase n=1 Tax=Rubritalea marina TaxID=361055 RepID=UPI000524F77D|nr:UTP--glucose-1-phosphate uridylyltransferase [Rubritalea marina]